MSENHKTKCSRVLFRLFFSGVESLTWWDGWMDECKAGRDDDEKVYSCNK